MKRSRWLIGSLVLLVSVLAVVLLWGPAQYRTYSQAHLELVKAPCAQIYCPAYQYDLFGDGTVVYQHAAIGSSPQIMAYKVSPLKAMLALWQLEHSDFKTAHWFGPGSSEGGGCSTVYWRSGKSFENGCLPIIDQKISGQLAAPLQPLARLMGLDAYNSDKPPTLAKDTVVMSAVPMDHKVETIFWQVPPPEGE